MRADTGAGRVAHAAAVAGESRHGGEGPGPATVPESLAATLCCPTCFPDSHRLSFGGGALHCDNCRAIYPVARSGAALVPWLYPDPGLAHLSWSARLKGFLRENTAEYNRLNRARNRVPAGGTAHERISAAMHARREHRQQVLSLLRPVWLDGDDLETPTTDLLNDRLPRRQALLSYAANVFRDWSWDNGENEALAEAVGSLLESARHTELGATLTLGAGACRLPYDVHRRFSPTRSVALDINPLLMLIGCGVVHGETLSLYEFPLAAIAGEGSGVLNRCSAPSALAEDDDFHCVLGDASAPPFAPESFDTVITPWLIDILAMDFDAFVRTVNRLLTTDGVWLNTGSLVFRSDDPRLRYSEEEVLRIVAQHGFEVIAADHRTVPYLQSPYSANGRIERVSGFVARKRNSAQCAARSSPMPDWVVDTTQPIPASAEVTVSSSSYLLHAQVLAAIDGKRSVDAIAKLVAREYNLGLEECVLVIQRILLDAVPGARADNPRT